MSESNASPFDMDSSSFDAEKYLERLLKDCSLRQIMDTEAAVVKDTQTLHSDMQTLVYENYNKFISATDTIRKMKDDFKQMESDVNLLMTKMHSITTFSEQITGTLQGTRSQLCRLSEKHSLGKDDCESLALAIFHSHWKSSSRRYKSSLIYFLHNAQMPLSFTAGSIFPIGLNTNITVAKLAFSVVTFVQQLNIADKLRKD